MGGAVMAVILNASTSSGLVTTADNSGQFAFQSNGVQFNPLLTAATAQASTSGTAITFTGIPSWAKRITIIFQAVQGSGTSLFLAQLGTSSGIVTSGYSSVNSYTNVVGAGQSSSAGFLLDSIHGAGATQAFSGTAQIVNINSNSWVYSSVMARADAYIEMGGGNISLSGSLTQLRITFVNGTDTFAAGTINIMYE